MANQKEDWTMIRVPRRLRDALDEFGSSMVEPEIKQQGNHEDPRHDGPPLWWVIQELLAREKKHRKRGSSNSVPRRRTGLREIGKAPEVSQGQQEESE